mmetsp:Transcript_10588/g.16587  ORF Transcript_10588/g.16587 Transcript_10588/m.16587 type:complete len:159 (-) Transcript_10588:6-482(-)
MPTLSLFSSLLLRSWSQASSKPPVQKCNQSHERNQKYKTVEHARMNYCAVPQTHAAANFLVLISQGCPFACMINARNCHGLTGRSAECGFADILAACFHFLRDENSDCEDFEKPHDSRHDHDGSKRDGLLSKQTEPQDLSRSASVESGLSDPINRQGG